MVQDPNVERVIKNYTEPLQKQISKIQTELEAVKKQCIISNVKVMSYDSELTNHKPDENASKCYKGLDEAYFSMNSVDFDYMLNTLQNKINTYRKM
jgi:hypothetical protein